ncbi:MAG: hypothetical protein GWM90_31050, partial [Gemmatimonadetes bacterium]|nr:OsmC family protein [Gemmatimonadota bacterium]NIQ55634.1 OsmC family protein [Gemmatimonadota bacterium]NIU79851.1 hypothetical protein [Gammaproteobacteria bacterium]NIX48340.1 hypothetical protein [Gemmatimonadota bacterium]NIY12787.1 hypothetical protein [Gemmatimonadota bacterium]
VTPGRLTSDVVGEVEKEDGILVIRRIRVTYRLRAPESARDTAERVRELHHEHCPVYRSIAGCIDITTALELEPE